MNILYNATKEAFYKNCVEEIESLLKSYYQFEIRSRDTFDVDSGCGCANILEMYKRDSILIDYKWEKCYSPATDYYKFQFYFQDGDQKRVEFSVEFSV